MTPEGFQNALSEEEIDEKVYHTCPCFEFQYRAFWSVLVL